MAFLGSCRDLQMDRRWWATIISGVVAATMTIAVNIALHQSLLSAEHGGILAIAVIGAPIVTLGSFLASTWFQRHADVLAAKKTHEEIHNVGDSVVDRVVEAIDARCGCGKGGAGRDGANSKGDSCCNEAA